jgi:hydrogenase expression/formation protein HypE
MPERGKVDRAFFEAVIYPNLGAERGDVAVGPTHGLDFGMLEVGERAVVCATDPVSVLPDLGFERAARFALGVILADVAVAGVAPTHLSISFSLPPELSDESFARLWASMDAELSELGTAVVAGHTARYDGATFPWVGGATALAVCDPADVVRPDGARPGDRLLVTTGAGVEAASLFAALFGEQIPLDEATLATAAEYLPGTEHVHAAVAAAAAGDVSAMHDATEGGLAGALNEMAAGAGVRFDVERDGVPAPDAPRAVAEALEFDPWRATSSGTLVLAVAPESVEPVREAVADCGLDVGVAGTVREGEGVFLDGERVPVPDGDSSWPVYADLS